MKTKTKKLIVDAIVLVAAIAAFLLTSALVCYLMKYGAELDAEMPSAQSYSVRS